MFLFLWVFLVTHFGNKKEPNFFKNVTKKSKTYLKGKSEPGMTQLQPKETLSRFCAVLTCLSSLF